MALFTATGLLLVLKHASTIVVLRIFLHRSGVENTERILPPRFIAQQAYDIETPQKVAVTAFARHTILKREMSVQIHLAVIFTGAKFGKDKNSAILETCFEPQARDFAGKI